MTSMRKESIKRHPSALVARNFALPLEAILVVLGVIAIVLAGIIPVLYTLTAWVIAAAGYLGLAIRQLIRAASDPDENQMQVHPRHKHTTWSRTIHLDATIIFLTALLGTIAAIPVMTQATDNNHPGLARGLGALTIIGSWVMLQTGWSRLYADSWFHGRDAEGLAFPDTDKPGLVEFLYYSFSIGATFQTSDTNVTATHMRWLTTIHAFVSFFYNSILLALAISIITGR